MSGQIPTGFYDRDFGGMRVWKLEWPTETPARPSPASTTTCDLDAGYLVRGSRCA